MLCVVYVNYILMLKTSYLNFDFFGKELMAEEIVTGCVS
jgi:hypothetical protein